MKKILFAFAQLIYAASFAQKLENSVNTSIKLLRENTIPSSLEMYYTTDRGQEGFWYYDTSDVKSADNTGAVLVSSNGKRFKRIFSGELNVKWFGAVGDYNGTTGTDNTTAFRQAIIAAANKSTVFIPKGNYLITDLLMDSTNNGFGYSLEGERYSRGANFDGATGGGYVSSKITFRPTDLNRPIVRVYNTASPGYILGVYSHKNLTFDFGDANGFVFGVENPETPTIINPSTKQVPTDGGGQAYIGGVKFDGCALEATWANRNSVSGVITRSGKRLVSLTKAFETSFNDVSFLGSDVQVYTWGCDRPVFQNIRSQGAHLPFDLNGAGNFSAQTGVDNLQIEGWTFAAMRINTEFAGTTFRLEQNDGNPTGGGRYSIPGTVAVTADSDVLTFSNNMNGILFPDLSILELVSGSNKINVLVKTVSGTTVTFYNTNTVITWAAPAATATRIHGYGVLSTGVRDVSLTGVTGAASLNCPAFVYNEGRAHMSIVNAQGVPGAYGDIRSMVIGNKTIAQYAVQGMMNFTGCSSVLTADANHPYVFIDNNKAPYGYSITDNNPNSRFATDPLNASLQTKRLWAFTPQSFRNAADNSTVNNPVVQISDNENTSQKIWCWEMRAVNGAQLDLADPTLPSDATSKIKITYRARSIGATGTLYYYFQGNGSGFAVTVNLTDTLKTFTEIYDMPSSWQGIPVSVVKRILFTGSGYYISGCTIEEIPASDKIATGTGTFTGSVTSTGLIVRSITMGSTPAPVMTSVQKTRIANPTAGMTVYCSDCVATDRSMGVIQTYNGSQWKNHW